MLILCCIAFAISVVGVACDTVDSNSSSVDGGGHTHAFSTWEITTPASCITDGVQSRSCESCGFTETAAISKTGHTIVIDNAVAPTCTTDGKSVGSHCGVCGIAIVPQNTIQATGHNYNDGEITSYATCVQQGIKKYTCTIAGCNYFYTESYSLQSYTATELYNIAKQFTGEIVVCDKKGAEFALGTCFVYSDDGKIITNYHVIDGAYSAKVFINDKEYSVSKVLAYDKNIDLAVLKITTTDVFAYANICKKTVKTGETVYAIGSSRGLTNTYSQGIITQAERVVDGVVHIQHDASITNGNSGGPLLNIYGEVIGINTWGLADSQNLNFAVFTSELDNLVFGTPISMAELYELNRKNPFDLLVDYIVANGTYDSSDGTVELRFVDGYQDSGTRYQSMGLTYYIADGHIILSNYSSKADSDITFFTGIVLRKSAEEYYYGTFIDQNGTTIYKMLGWITAGTFTQNTLVGYTTYEGLADMKTTVREDASADCIYILAYFQWFLGSYLDLSIADFGFTSF